MAIVEKPVAPWVLMLDLVDNGGSIHTKTYQLQSTDAATAATDAAAIMAAYANVSDLAVRGYTIGHRYIENALTFPASGIEWENQAILSVRLASDPTKYATLTIEGVKPGVFVAASGPNAEVVDTGDAATNTYVGLFTSTSEAYLSDGELADASLAFSGRRRHIKTRKG